MTSFVFYDAIDYINVFTLPVLIPIVWSVWYWCIKQPDFQRKTQRSPVLAFIEFYFGIVALIQTFIRGIENTPCYVSLISHFNWAFCLTILLLRISRFRLLERLSREKLLLSSSVAQFNSEIRISDIEADLINEIDSETTDDPKIEQANMASHFLLKHHNWLSNDYIIKIYFPIVILLSLLIVISSIPEGITLETPQNDDLCEVKIVFPIYMSIIVLASIYQCWKIRNIHNEVFLKRELFPIYCIIFLLLGYYLLSYQNPRSKNESPWPNLYPYGAFFESSIGVWYMAKNYWVSNQFVDSWILGPFLLFLKGYHWLFNSKQKNDEMELDLQIILFRPELRKFLEEFMTRCFCIENLVYFVQVENFKNKISLTAANDIYNLFIKADSEFQVNISYEHRTAIEKDLLELKSMESTDPEFMVRLGSIFEFSQLEVYNLIKMDIWPRFQHSEYGKYCETTYSKMKCNKLKMEDSLLPIQDQENSEILTVESPSDESEGSSSSENEDTSSATNKISGQRLGHGITNSSEKLVQLSPHTSDEENSSNGTQGLDSEASVLSQEWTTTALGFE